MRIFHSPFRSSTSAASISSAQSADTVRPVPSTPATSIECSFDADQRWSAVVPPESGLTFAVVWDSDADDIVTFSAPELFESHATEPDSPSDAYDNRSQILTIGPSLLGAPGTGAPSEYSHTPATLQYFRENTGFAGPLFIPARERERDGARPAGRRTQTSSTLDGLDVYLRGSLLGKAHNANRYASCFRALDDDFAFDPRTSFARAHMHTWMQAKGLARDDVSDEGFFEGGVFEGLPSRFSMTTTSTSNYVSVENEMDDASSSTWSTLEAPNTPSYSRLLFPVATPDPAASGSMRRLRKTRPVPGPASPADVLRRPGYSHTVPTGSPNSRSRSHSRPARSQTPMPTPSPPSPTSSGSAAPLKRTLSSMRSLPSLPKLSLRRARGKFRGAESASADTDTNAGPGWVWIAVTDDMAKRSQSPAPQFIASHS
ncbi:hypothetical protein GGX14DRAFT_579503 [Mycena pura]|uniref:Uncharacterized protein n=1 Tax=Mycena pura TaxID=153505 RepID=A0AAD6Y0A6_9AGAR|nr:hypothetical protein GGX14DRAFT_579503 [Mycena pura]